MSLPIICTFCFLYFYYASIVYCTELCIFMCYHCSVWLSRLFPKWRKLSGGQQSNSMHSLCCDHFRYLWSLALVMWTQYVAALPWDFLPTQHGSTPAGFTGQFAMVLRCQSTRHPSCTPNRQRLVCCSEMSFKRVRSDFWCETWLSSSLRGSTNWRHNITSLAQRQNWRAKDLDTRDCRRYHSCRFSRH